MAGIPTFSPDPSLYADPTGRAGRICRFLRNLRLWEGDAAGQRFPLARFQDAMVRRIYGPTDEHGRRLVRIACVWIPRGNAKTTLAAGLGLAHFMGPEAEAGGQVVMGAADRENAGIAFNCSHQMVMQDAALDARVRAVESRKALHHPRTKSTLKAISHEAYSKHGLNVSFFLADELHAWPPVEGRKLFKVVTDSMVKRSQPLTVIISTAGEGKGHLASDMWEYSKRVASGEIDDPHFAPIIFAADPSADWRDEDAWRAANPAIEEGFLSVEELRIKAKRIEHFPSEIADFKRFHLDLWQEGVANPWIDLEVYDAAEPMTPLSDLRGRSCWVGVDLASVEDLAAAVAVFPSGDEGDLEYDVVPMFFLPEEGLARKADKERADYLRWKEAGFLRTTPGNVIDHGAIVDYLADELAPMHRVEEVSIDRWNSTAVEIRLQDAGFTVHRFGQGFASMAAPVRDIKRALLKRVLRHGGHPVLRMCFGNVVADKDPAGNEKFTKARALGKIDGASATANAIGRILAAEGGPSVYDTDDRAGGFLTL